MAATHTWDAHEVLAIEFHTIGNSIVRQGRVGEVLVSPLYIDVNSVCNVPQRLAFEILIWGVCGTFGMLSIFGRSGL